MLDQLKIHTIFQKTRILNKQLSLTPGIGHTQLWRAVHATYPKRCRQAGKKETLHMDTNDLSRETYDAIIGTPDEFHHDLTLQFGIMADDCSDDNEFLDISESLI